MSAQILMPTTDAEQEAVRLLGYGCRRTCELRWTVKQSAYLSAGPGGAAVSEVYYILEQKWEGLRKLGMTEAWVAVPMHVPK